MRLGKQKDKEIKYSEPSEPEDVREEIIKGEQESAWRESFGPMDSATYQHYE